MSTSQSPAAALSLRAPAAPAASPDWHTLPQVDQDREAAKLLLAMACDPTVAPHGSRHHEVLMHAVAAVGVRLQHTPAVGMVALTQRVARLNPAAGEIGAGMLASLVTDARRLVEAA